MTSKLDEFMAEIKAYDYKWFDQIGGNEALAEIGRLRKQAAEQMPAPDNDRCICGGPYYPDTAFGEVCCRCQSPRRY
jgi:hypothetical protein